MPDAVLRAVRTGADNMDEIKLLTRGASIQMGAVRGPREAEQEFRGQGCYFSHCSQVTPLRGDLSEQRSLEAVGSELLPSLGKSTGPEAGRLIC